MDAGDLPRATLFIVGRTDDGVWLERLVGKDTPKRHLVRDGDPELIVDPTDEDLDLAEAFERGEITAFEYPAGHTFPSVEKSRSERHDFVNLAAINSA